jgi:hypothetical protein
MSLLAHRIAARFLASLDVSTPAKAADVLLREIEAILPGHFVSVEAQRGVGLKFARMNPDEHLRKQVQTSYAQTESNMEFGFVLAPGSGASWGPGLNLKLSKDWPDLKEAGITFRAMSKLTPEKGVEAIVAFFKKNAPKIKNPGG